MKEKDHNNQINESKGMTILCCKCKENFQLSTFFNNHFNQCLMIDIRELSKELITTLNELTKAVQSSLNDKDSIKDLLLEYAKHSKDVFINDLPCLICGATISLNSFEIHYSNCKLALKNSHIKDMKTIEEPEILKDLLRKLINDESIPLKMIKEYMLEANALFKSNQLKRCSRCGKNVSPNTMTKHMSNCSKRRRSMSKDLNKENDLFNNDNIYIKDDKALRRNRKKSMEHLKKITSEEVKCFKLLNFKVIHPISIMK